MSPRFPIPDDSRFRSPTSVPAHAQVTSRLVRITAGSFSPGVDMAIRAISLVPPRTINGGQPFNFEVAKAEGMRLGVLQGNDGRGAIVGRWDIAALIEYHQRFIEASPREARMPNDDRAFVEISEQLLGIVRSVPRENMGALVGALVDFVHSAALGQGQYRGFAIAPPIVVSKNETMWFRTASSPFADSDLELEIVAAERHTVR